ncbi:hypothetical protein SAMN04489762_3444 [Terribacillus saccharophilus]|uniref:Uncharacterized protein n=1 Tax=Terribacillus saccharophilus TaxID=361277 RepID=A0AAX2EJX3_9BACI|nr:hypothetical protein SAMN04489762_3444 [Terribacillus saccharophilus]
MREYFAFEIEANGKPIYAFGEWEGSNNYTTDAKLAQEENVVAYGEIKDGRYIELFKK